MTTEATALQRYNNLFDNRQYSALAELLARDLAVPRDSVRMSDIMNIITAAALELANHPHYPDAWLKLATFCGQNTVSIATIDAIHTYLLIYQQPGNNRADDFELTAKALRQAYASSDTLKTAVSYANGVHGWQGRVAYDLLAASDLLVQAAIQLLIHGNPSYIHEKLQSGLQRIVGALHEGIRHSEHPEMFDFSGTHFPTKDDAQPGNGFNVHG